MSAEPHPVPRLITNTAIEDLNRDKLHAHLEADPDWQFVETANETYLWNRDLVHGRFLLYQHRVERHHTIAVPAPGSGPTNPAWREQALCTVAGHAINALALLLDPDTSAVAVDRLTQIAMLTTPGTLPTAELLTQLHQIATFYGSH